MSVDSAKDFPDTDAEISKDCIAHDKQTILEDALQIGQRWLAALAEDDPQRPLVDAGRQDGRGSCPES